MLAFDFEDIKVFKFTMKYLKSGLLEDKMERAIKATLSQNLDKIFQYISFFTIEGYTIYKTYEVMNKETTEIMKSKSAQEIFNHKLPDGSYLSDKIKKFTLLFYEE